MELFNKMALFGKVLTEQQREHLLVAALYNDLRLYEDAVDVRVSHIQRMFSLQKDALTGKFSKVKLDLPITRDNWQEQITEAHQQLLLIPGTKPFERSFVLNVWLYRSGFCPLVRYAFDQWHELDASPLNAKKNIENIADLSTTFLYRLVPVTEAITTPNLLGAGAYSNVYASDDGLSIYKVPRNLASRDFASQEEFEASNYALNSGFTPYLPKLLSYDQTTGVIQRELIRGTTGFKLLGSEAFVKEPYALDQIKDIHSVACDIFHKDGINFDIHPGNMMWADDRHQWVIVDLGPMPTIGAEYFPRDNFKNYFQKIWLDLYGLIVDVPIRSLDINLNEAAALRVPKHVLNLGL